MLEMIEEFLRRDEEHLRLDLDPSHGKTISWVHDHAHVVSRKDREGRVLFDVYMSQKNLDKLLKTDPSVLFKKLRNK